MNTGLVSLEVSNNGVDFSSSGTTVEARPPVLVTGMFPPAGPASGHTVVNIYGSQFYDAGVPVQCKFGEVMQSVAELVNQSHVRCASPPYAGAWVVDVAISFDNQTFISTLQIFRYDPVAHLIRLSPSTGPQFGGTALTAVGTSFQNSGHSACRFTAASGTESELSPSARWL